METIENLPTLISNVLNFVANAAKNLDFVRVRIKIHQELSVQPHSLNNKYVFKLQEKSQFQSIGSSRETQP